MAAASFLAALALAMTASPTDFRDFYCTGAVANAHRDPYLVEPLRSCQERLAGGTLFPGLVVPAVIPAYAIVPFRLLAMVPFELARTIFTAGELMAVVATFVVLRRLTLAPLVPLAIVIVVADLYVSLLTGQIAVFSVAAAALAAAALAHGRPRAAGAFAVASLFEPHLGLPVVVTLFALVPRARPAIGAGVGLLGVVTLAAPNHGYAREYVSRVLVAHLRSELHLGGQLGTAHLLTLAGVPDGPAMRIASAGYGAAVAAVVALLARARTPVRDPQLVFAPLAAGIAFSPFGHVTQCCAAIPFLVVLCRSDVPVPIRTLAAWALAVLSVPLLTFGPNQTSPAVAVAFGIATALAAASLARLPRTVVLTTCVASGIYVLAIVTQLVPDPSPPPELAAHLEEVPPDALAQAVWQRFVEPLESGSGPASTIAKLGTWLALFTSTALITTVGSSPRAPAWVKIRRAAASGVAELPNERA